jgi:hypothetical protein
VNCCTVAINACCDCVSGAFCSFAGFDPPTATTHAFNDCVCQPEVCGAGACALPCAGMTLDHPCDDCAENAASTVCSSAYAACPHAVKMTCSPYCMVAISSSYGLGGPVCNNAAPASLTAYQDYVACAKQHCANECVLVTSYQFGADKACRDCMNAACAAASLACSTH